VHEVHEFPKPLVRVADPGGKFLAYRSALFIRLRPNGGRDARPPQPLLPRAGLYPEHDMLIQLTTLKKSPGLGAR
jgi:hypothetical protein